MTVATSNEPGRTEVRSHAREGTAGTTTFTRTWVLKQLAKLVVLGALLVWAMREADLEGRLGARDDGPSHKGLSTPSSGSDVPATRPSPR